MQRMIFVSVTLLLLSVQIVRAHVLVREGGAYDSDQDLTWLVYANIAGDLGYPAGSTLNWTQAQDFVAFVNTSITPLGKNDWRLPQVTSDASSELCLHVDGRQSTSRQEGFKCTGSEIGDLFYVEVDNVARPTISTPTTPDRWALAAQQRRATLQNYYGFSGIDPSEYWIDLGASSSAPNQFVFNFFNGFQTTAAIAGHKRVVLVRDGDVAPFDFTDRGDGTVSDDGTGLMWLKDARYSVTTNAGPGGNGMMAWPDAQTWVQALTFVGYDDWRLPNAPQMDPTCRDSPNPNVRTKRHCSGSELGHLYWRQGVSSTTLGPFVNVPTRGMYTWGPEHAASTTAAFVFSFFWGETGLGNKSAALPVWPVRDRQPTDTPTGSNVTIDRDPGVRITFPAVAAGGATRVATSGSNPGSTLAGHELLTLFYDIASTATYSGAVVVCLDYPAAEDPATLKLAHHEAGAWVIVDPPTVQGGKMCGSVTSLSWFALAKPAGAGSIDLLIVLLLAASLVIARARDSPPASTNTSRRTTFPSQ